MITLISVDTATGVDKRWNAHTHREKDLTEGSNIGLQLARIQVIGNISEIV